MDFNVVEANPPEGTDRHGDQDREASMTSKLECVPALDLVLDHGRHRVTRGTRPPVDLGGNCRLWQVLTELCRRYDDYYPARDLRAAVWDDCYVEYETLWAAVSELRKRLRPLGLTVKHVKGLGYRLEDLWKRPT